MNISERFWRLQLELTKPITDGAKLDTARGVQEKIGRLMHFTRRREVVVLDKSDER